MADELMAEEVIDRSGPVTSDQWLAERRQRAQAPEPVEETVQPEPSIPDDDETATEEDPTFVDEGAHSEGEPEETPAESAEEAATLTHIRDVANSAGLDLDEVLDSMQVEVPINGKKETVILREALEGYSRQSDYGRKSRELAEERKSFQEQRGQAENALVQKLEGADVMLQMLAEDLQLYDPAAINQLVQEDPETGMRLKSEYDLKMQRFQQIAGQKQALQQQQVGDRGKEVAKIRREQQEILASHMPEMRDPAKASAFEERAGKLLKSIDFSDQEISEYFGGAWDNRHIRLMNLAMKAMDAEETADKKLKAKKKRAPRMNAGGTRKSSAPQNTQPLEQARSNLRSGGSVRDGAALLAERRRLRNGGSQ